MASLSYRLVRLPLLVTLDLLAAIAVYVLSLFLASNGRLEVSLADALVRGALPVSVFFVVVAAARGLYRVRARYIGLYDFLNISVVGLISGLFVAVLGRLAGSGAQPWAVPVLFGFGVITAIVGSRVALRLYSWRQIPFAMIPGRQKQTRTLIVGAGDAGEMILRENQKNPSSSRLICGLVDDDPEKRALIIQGIRVMGTTEDVPQIVETLSIDEIIIAVPSASGDEMRRIVEVCKTTPAKVRTLPSVNRLLTTNARLGQHLREVEIEDLLRRETTKVDPARVSGFIRGESILITGGGGSIGSELARQAARLSPGSLVLLGKGENALYDIEQEILHTTSVEPAAFVGDVRSARSVENAFGRYQPSLVFHAAAHKHVPLMQANPIEAIENNVFGTLTTAEAAIRHGVRRFVYISTDKAVNPTSVMGATKRVGEMIVSALAQQSDTSFAIVRFGNVLGSRGSLIPLLKSQIARGGPVRVTHPDMTRYFMTIPEAVQLILHAGASGSNGDLFILDMGEPVRILDLAEDLIRLHGLEPHKDIEIKFIGIRPGEKTHEELVYSQEELLPTDHPKINMTRSRACDWAWLSRELEALRELCNAGDQDRARQFLMDLANGRTAYGVVEFRSAEERV